MREFKSNVATIIFATLAVTFAFATIGFAANGHSEQCCAGMAFMCFLAGVGMMLDV